MCMKHYNKLVTIAQLLIHPNIFVNNVDVEMYKLLGEMYFVPFKEKSSNFS